MHRTILVIIGAAIAAGVLAKSEMIIHRRDSSAVIVPVSSVDSMTFTSCLLTYYPFNGNTLDEGGNNNAGLSYSGNPTTDRFGDSSRAYQFDGTTNNFFVPGAKARNDFTMSAWILNEGSVKDVQTIAGDLDTVNNAGSVLYMTPENRLIVAFGDSSAGPWPYASLRSASTVPRDEWHFVAAVRNGTTLKIYIDGELDTTGACGPNDIGQLGFYSVGGRVLNGFHGKIDQVRFYGCALPDQTIAALSREGSLK